MIIPFSFSSSIEESGMHWVLDKVDNVRGLQNP
jgi:hypothetical protein